MMTNENDVRKTLDTRLFRLNKCIFKSHTFRLAGSSRMERQASRMITPISLSSLLGSSKGSVIGIILQIANSQNFIGSSNLKKFFEVIRETLPAQYHGSYGMTKISSPVQIQFIERKAAWAHEVIGSEVTIIYLHQSEFWDD